MNRKFCHICGSKITPKTDRSWWCDTCGQLYYDNPRPTTSAVLFTEDDKVLLTKRAFEPGKGKWDLPGGFLEGSETLEEAIVRELKEELGITLNDKSQLKYNGSYCAEYPWGKETYLIVDANFVGRIDSQTELKPADDVESFQFVDLGDLEKIEFSFGPHIEVIQAAAKSLGIS